jgi:glutathione S-transferase
MAGPWEAAGVDKALGIEVSPEQKMFVAMAITTMLIKL